MRHHEGEIVDGVAQFQLRDAAEAEPTTRFARGTREFDRLAKPEAGRSGELALVETLEQVAHDLRGPLQTIGLETSLLVDKLAPADVENRAAVARISRNVLFLDRLIQDLVDYGAIEAGQLEIRKQPTELGALIANAIDRVVSTRDRPRVQLATSAPCVLAIDELRIERVFANLLQNALKYAPRTSRIVIRIDVERDRVRTSVIDAGPGMTIDEKTHVFEKYRRGASAGGHEGSGLGLHISKQIVEAHGGTIGVTTLEGIGSVFFFVLPSQ